MIVQLCIKKLQVGDGGNPTHQQTNILKIFPSNAIHLRVIRHENIFHEFEKEEENISPPHIPYVNESNGFISVWFFVCLKLIALFFNLIQNN